jgi:hypothetical protein
MTDHAGIPGEDGRNASFVKQPARSSPQRAIRLPPQKNGGIDPPFFFESLGAKK